MFLYEGKEYARVSDILQAYCDFSGIDPDVLKAKAELGTQVHDAICSDVRDEFPYIPAKGHGYFKSYLKWKDELHPIFLQNEKRYFCNKKMLTGCIDAVVQFGNAFPVLIDFKTSAQESSTWNLQGHLYYYLLKANSYDISPNFLFLKLNTNGDFPTVYQYKYNRNIMAKMNKAIENFWSTRKSDSH